MAVGGFVGGFVEWFVEGSSKGRRRAVDKFGSYDGGGSRALGDTSRHRHARSRTTTIIGGRLLSPLGRAPPPTSATHLRFDPLFCMIIVPPAAPSTRASPCIASRMLRDDIIVERSRATRDSPLP